MVYAGGEEEPNQRFRKRLSRSNQEDWYHFKDLRKKVSFKGLQNPSFQRIELKNFKVTDCELKEEEWWKDQVYNSDFIIIISAYIYNVIQFPSNESTIDPLFNFKASSKYQLVNTIKLLTLLMDTILLLYSFYRQFRRLRFCLFFSLLSKKWVGIGILIGIQVLVVVVADNHYSVHVSSLELLEKSFKR